MGDTNLPYLLANIRTSNGHQASEIRRQRIEKCINVTCEEEHKEGSPRMSLTEIFLIVFLIGTIGTMLVALSVGLAFRRYRRELIEVGDAQTTLGVIGSIYLEGKSDVLVGSSIAIPVSLMCYGGVGLYFLYWGFQNILPATSLLLGGLLVFVILFWIFVDVKARREARRVLRNHFSHRDEEILRLELVRLHEGDDNQRKAFDLIAERGSKASLVAREIRGDVPPTGS